MSQEIDRRPTRVYVCKCFFWSINLTVAQTLAAVTIFEAVTTIFSMRGKSAMFYGTFTNVLLLFCYDAFVNVSKFFFECFIASL